MPIRFLPLSLGGSTETYLPAHRWEGGLAYRWFSSSPEHYVGTTVRHDLDPRLGEITVDSHAIDLLATYALTERFSVSLLLPFVYGERRSRLEHDNINYHTMSAGGLGDLRLTAHAWLLNPAKHPEGNVAVGAGVKAPTGDDRAADISYRATGPVLVPVDVAIQPGDGGWGMNAQSGSGTALV